MIKNDKRIGSIDKKKKEKKVGLKKDGYLWPVEKLHKGVLQMTSFTVWP